MEPAARHQRRCDRRDISISLYLRIASPDPVTSQGGLCAVGRAGRAGVEEGWTGRVRFRPRWTCGLGLACPVHGQAPQGAAFPAAIFSRSMSLRPGALISGASWLVRAKSRMRRCRWRREGRCIGRACSDPPSFRRRPRPEGRGVASRACPRRSWSGEARPAMGRLRRSETGAAWRRETIRRGRSKSCLPTRRGGTLCSFRGHRHAARPD